MNSGLIAHPQLSWIGSATNWEEVLQRFADLAEKEGFARPGFGAALIQREKEYPTGLPMQIPLAIPHAYPEFIYKPGVGVALLDPPVEFREMGGEEDQWLSVRLVVLMLVAQETAHNSDLATIIRMFQNPDWYPLFSKATAPEELANSFQSLFAKEDQVTAGNG